MGWLHALLKREPKTYRRPAPKKRRVAFCRLGLEELEERILLAAISWINPASGFWDVPGNWSGGVVPTSTDDVTINVPGITVTVRDFRSVNSLTTGTGSVLALPSGELDMLTASALQDGFNISGGDLGGSGPVTVTGSSSWSAGGISAGKLINNGTITLTNAAGTLDLLADSSTLVNNGTIIQQGAGSLRLDTLIGGAPSMLQNQAGAFYIFENDSNVAQGFNSGGIFTNAGTIRKTTTTGTSAITTQLASSGTIDVETGTLVLAPNSGSTNTGGDFTVAANATLDLTGGTIVQYAGSYTGSGAGIILLQTGALGIANGAATFNFPAGMFTWASGTIDTQGGTLTNDGTINLTNPSGTIDILDGSGSLVNNGTINQQGAGPLRLDTLIGGTATKLQNQAGAFYIFQADSNLAQGFNSGGIFTNAGTIRKMTTTGTSAITTQLASSGTIDVQTGTLVLAPATGSTNTGGDFTVAKNATLDLTGGTIVQYAGTYTGSGGGTITIQSGAFTVANGAASLNFPAGMLSWGGGTIDTEGGTLTNYGTLTLTNSTGTDDVLENHGTLINEGTIIQQGTGDLRIDGVYGPFLPTYLQNDPGAFYIFQADSNIRNGQNGGGNINNEGTIQKLAGTGNSSITLPVTNSGTIDVESGTIALVNSTIDNRGGSFIVAQNATLDLTGGGTEGYSGNFATTGTGTVLLASGNLAINGAATFDFPGNTFQWTGGIIKTNLGDLTNTGTINLSGPTTKYLVGSNMLDNMGTMIQSGAGNLDLSSGFQSPTKLTIESGAFYLFESDAGMVDSTSTPAAVINDGTIEKTAGTGVSPISLTGISGELLNNTGTIEATSGTISIQATAITQVSGSTLTGGTWVAQGGASIALTSNPNLTTNQANVTLAGAGSAFPSLNNLTSNSGVFTVESGATFTTVGALTNTGSIAIGPAGTLSVKGNYSQGAAGTLSIQLGGMPASGQFGQLNATGAATLNGTLQLSLINRYTPTTADSFQILSFASQTGSFSAINSPLYRGGDILHVAVSATNVTVGAVTNTSDLAVTSIDPLPANAAIGQPITIGWTVQNLAGVPATGTWDDSVYLSATGVLDANSVLLGRVPHTGPVPSGPGYHGTLTMALPPILGSVYAIVVADSGGLVPDINRANNLLVSTTAVPITVPLLTIGRALAGTIANQQSLAYELNPPAGQDVRLTATFTALPEAVFSSSYGALPTPTTAIQTAPSEFAATQQLLISGAQGGAYYILLQGLSGAGSGSSFTLQAALVPFQVSSVTPSQGANVGPVTITLSGSQFTPQTVVALHSVSGTTLTATQVIYQSENSLFATFNLTGLKTGSYDVEATDHGQTVADTGGFTVTNGSPGQVTFTLSNPSVIPVFKETTVVVTYKNVGDTDAPAPLMLLSTDNGEFRLSDQDPYQVGSIQLFGYNANGPAGTLPPGAGGSITVQFLPIQFGGHVVSNFTLGAVEDPSATIDWASLKAGLQPPGLSNAAWNVDFANFTSLVGTTAGQYQAVLDADATYLSRLGEYTADAGKLQALELQIADSFGAISQRNTAGQFGMGNFGPNDFNVLTLPSGEVQIQQGNLVRLFVPNSSGSGYQGEFGDAATATLIPNTPKGGGTATAGSFVVLETDGTINTFSVTLNAGAITSGTLSTSEDANGDTVTFTANGSSDSFGNTYTYVTNSLGNLVVTDPVGRTATLVFDSSKDLLSVTTAAGTTSFTYVTGGGPATAHAVASITFTDGSHEYFNYDSLGRVIETTFDSNTDPVTYSYDQFGEVTITDKTGDATTVSPNDLGQIAELENPVGQVFSALFDANNNLTQVNGPLGTTVTATNNNLGDPTSITDPDGNTINLTYNSNPNTLTSLTDARGIKTTYTSDSRGNLETITYADGTTQQFQYDSAGNLIASTDQLDQLTKYTYNAQNLLTDISYADGTSVSYTYDAHRNLATATDASGTTTFTYDAADRLTEVAYPNGMFLKYTYNALGQETQIINQDNFAVNYQYDPLDRLSGLTNGTGASIVTYSYNSDGQLSGENMGNGTATTYAYDANGDITSLVNSGPGGVLSSFQYTYNALGLPVSVTTPSGTTTYGYDADGQLTSADLPGGPDISYQYDAAGNRISSTENGVTTNYTTNNLSEYTAIGGTTYAYDADGRLTTMTNSSGTTSYSYNGAGQLASVVSPTDNFSYQYDALGNLAATVQNGQQTTNLIDPTGLGNVVAQYNASGLVADYTYGLGLTSQVTSAGAAYYAFDAGGNTASLTGATGVVLDSYTYLPFGATLNSTGSTANPFTFAGQFGVSSDGSGLLSMRNRIYDPQVGRFTQPDPTGLLGGDANLYRYVYNSPVQNADPSGLGDANIVGGNTTGNNANFSGQQGTGGQGRQPPTPQKPPVTTAVEKEVQAGVQQQVERGVEEKAVLKAEESFVKVGAKAAIGELLGGLATAFEVAADVVAVVATADTIITLLPFALVALPFILPGPALADEAHNHLQQLKSNDPNDLTGPAGFGTVNFVSPAETFPYRIDFENEPTASAPAQVVTITEQLDPNLDWDTFQLGDYGFGGQIFHIPAGSTTYSTQLDERSTLGIYVDIAANFNTLTGLLTWSFTSIDPATGDVPENVLVGFLPLDVTPPEGEGFISYTVLPKATLTTGTVVGAQASVVFDRNAALPTITYTNTIDAGPPTSKVSPLPATESTTNFTVSWTGHDVAGGSGIASFDIFVSDNGGPFALFQTDTTATSATFTGQAGHTYGFYSIATDNVGNVEPAKTAAEATTTVAANAGSGGGGGGGSGGGGNSSPLTADQNYVQNLYFTDLGRQGSLAELNFWVAYLNQTNHSLLAVAAGIDDSPEARTHLVKGWYVSYLGRQAQNGEEQGFVQSLLQGASEQQVQAEIIGSPEFAARANVLIGGSDASSNYIQALYSILLGRTGSTTEVNAYLPILSTQTGRRLGTSLPIVQQQTRTAIASIFLASAEYRDLQVGADYVDLLGRAGAPSELLGWENSDLGLQSIQLLFESSQEFYKL